MILKVFKEKSNQKYINKLLSESREAISNTKINAVGVILNSDEFSDFEAFRTFFKNLGVQPARTRIVTFVEDSKNANELWDTYFDPKDFGWKGKIKNAELEVFIDTEFDLLISFYAASHLELDMITAASKANFKVGLSREDHRFYDLIINVKPKEFDIFKVELKKYLTILNKL
ncbi:DUF6913 domain-containing protein [Psychroserpens sp.]|uniref:DUF6913 domain-containing protein n=1 Tax=Psychroserpens sp. TaxID=2020870 RepID=UPI003C74B032